MKRSSSSVLDQELFHAIKKGDLCSIKDLVDQGADIHAHEFSCGTNIHMATYYGHWHLLPFLINRGLNVNAIDGDNRNTPLHLASGSFHAEAHHAKAVQFLLDQNANMDAMNSFGQKPIHVAAKTGQKDVIEIFLKKGMDVKEADGNGSTLLHLSCLKGKLEVVQVLVNYKADLHAKDKNGCKPIHIAAAWGQKDVVKYFLDLGMSDEEMDKNGQTALHIAAKRGRLEVVQLLVDRIGAKSQLDAQDHDGNTPMHVCSLEQRILNCLLDAGARSDVKDHVGRTVLFYLIEHCTRHFCGYKDRSILAKMNHNWVDIDDLTKTTAAHLLVNHDDMDLIKLVLQYQKDLNVENKYRKTPMNYITRNLSPSNIDKRETLIRMFVNHGAYLKVHDYKRIVRNLSLKKRLFIDKKFCSQCLVNKFDNRDLPMLARLPSAISLSVLEKLKLKSGQICVIERDVEEEIRKKGHCHVSKMTPSLLSILAIKAYLSYYHTS